MKTMIVTGASSGIGRALAVRAVRAGYDVSAIGRNQTALDALAAAVAAEGGDIAIEALDIAQPAHARGAIARVLARTGRIDVLVNNAGFVSAGPISLQSDEELQRQFGTHVLGPLALVREALPALRAARGHVFMLGSGVARVPVGALGAYPPAKAALRSATAILRRELRAQGIAVTYVDPGAVDTPFMSRAGMPGAPAAMLASPEAVARKILLAAGRGPRVLNAVPWQTAAVALAELVPNLTELLLDRAPMLVGGGAAPPAATSVATAVHETGPDEDAQPVEAARPPRADTFEGALEPLQRRMEKLKLSEAFVRGLLVPQTTLELSDVAMRWAGMPNKHERAVTEDVLDALADAGYVIRNADLTYRVVRSA